MAGRLPHLYLAARASLHAFLALVPGHGHQTATSIMRAVNEGAAEEALRLIDESHARLLDDRRTLQAVESALRELEPTTVSEPGGRFIGPLAGKLGIRPATLRKWERAALVRPCRDPRTAYRVYDEADVRDARLAHQLRRGGYLLEQIAPLIAQVRAAGGLEPLEAALRDWRGRLSARGRADAGRGCRVGGVPPRARMSLRPPARSGTPRADTSFGARDTFLTGTP